MDWILEEHQLEKGGERYYSEDYLKMAFTENTPIRIVELLDFEHEEFERILKIFNEFNTFDKIIVYIDSSGGSMSIKDKLLTLFIQYPNLELVACSNLQSAAFNLFIEMPCGKTITEMATSAFHQVTLTNRFNTQGKPKDELAAYLDSRRNHLSEYTNDFMDMCEFSAEERQVIEQDKDLYLTPQRVMEMENSYRNNEG